MTTLSAWGRLSREPHGLVGLADRGAVASLIGKAKPGIAFGMGRSYGDVCLNPGGTAWQTRGLDKFIKFDTLTGRLAVESGVLLRDIQAVTMPQGWRLPVTPGTQVITVGGAIANDVHGKNHHRHGTFGEHVRSLKLARTSGEVLACGREDKPEWLQATVGGLGLTGVVLEAELQLVPSPGPWVDAETIPYRSLTDFFDLSRESEAGWEHTVSWFDCLARPDGRGLFMRGNTIDRGAHPEPAPHRRSMPFVPPLSLVNALSLRAFNALYFNLHAWTAKRAVVPHEAFFYPLDNLANWNRMYGPRGFYQYQSVVPMNGGKDAVKAMLDAIARSGEGSFLAVIKTFADRKSAGLLSFPREGVTLALDFPNRGVRTLRLFDRLDAIVMEAGGRLYPAKDARMPRAMFQAGYPRLNEFMAFRDSGIRSGLSRRLMDEGP